MKFWLLWLNLSVILLTGWVGYSETVALAAYAASPAEKPHLVIVVAEDEYHSDRTLPAFAEQHLQDQFRVSLVIADPAERHQIRGIEKLQEADVALFAIRRRLLPKPQLDIVRRYLAQGKPLIALRMTSHAFSPLGNESLRAGHDQWPTFDRVVLGCRYEGHYGNKSEDAEPTIVWTRPEAVNHPILSGVDPQEHKVTSWLYKSRDLGDKTKILLEGRVGDNTVARARRVHQPHRLGRQGVLHHVGPP